MYKRTEKVVDERSKYYKALLYLLTKEYSQVCAPVTLSSVSCVFYLGLDATPIRTNPNDLEERIFYLVNISILQYSCIAMIFYIYQI
jgi:hypothetical protein